MGCTYLCAIILIRRFRAFDIYVVSIWRRWISYKIDLIAVLTTQKKFSSSVVLCVFPQNSVIY